MNSVSIIVTTYNRPSALGVVLDSLVVQEVVPSEIIVADDGSALDTAELIERCRQRQIVPIVHIWQEDVGFRAAMARNRAAARATGDYLIFLDGDCVVFPDFVRRHLELAAPGRFLAGNRLLSSPRLTELIEDGYVNPMRWSFFWWLWARLIGDTNRLIPLLRLPDWSWRQACPSRWQGVKTCNLGLWREDFIMVNGFDENFQGWGHEDADLAVRLISAGIKRKNGRFAVPVLHLWHKENSRGNEQQNRQRLQDVIDGRRPYRTQHGVDGYL